MFFNFEKVKFLTLVHIVYSKYRIETGNREKEKQFSFSIFSQFLNS